MDKKTFNIFVIGCQMNKSDSERISGYLSGLGYLKTDDVYGADLAIITTCGVRQSAEDRIYGLIPAIKKKNKNALVVVTGCLSGESVVKNRLKKYVDVWMPINELAGLKDKLESIKNSSNELGERAGEYLKIKANYNSKYSAFVPIGNGCNNFCSYCYVPYARGREVYRDWEDIVLEVKNLLKNGYKEITLIAQNVNSYKFNKVDFPKLLTLVNSLEGKFWLRFATSHPKDMNDDLIKTLGKCNKLCHHIHLPAQSGDDEIIKKMNRRYTSKHYLYLISRIRETLDKKKDEWVPKVSISTDIIVGFPGETEKQFLNTAKLFAEAKFDMAYIAQYSPRPRTKSAEMDDNVPASVKKRREEHLMNILRKTSYENNLEYSGKIVELLIEGIKRDGYFFGKTKTSKSVKFSTKNNKKIKTGDIVKVVIEKVYDFGMEGKLV